MLQEWKTVYWRSAAVRLHKARCPAHLPRPWLLLSLVEFHWFHSSVPGIYGRYTRSAYTGIHHRHIPSAYAGIQLSPLSLTLTRCVCTSSIHPLARFSTHIEITQSIRIYSPNLSLSLSLSPSLAPRSTSNTENAERPCFVQESYLETAAIRQPEATS